MHEERDIMKTAVRFSALLSVAWMLCLVLLVPGSARSEDVSVRIGYFPNITHAHALIAQNMAAEGEGWFETRIPGLKLSWVSFNAGPSAMEAFFAKTVDLTYVGPNPALNAFIRAKGREVRVVSGAVRGGAALVVARGQTMKDPADFKGKKIATPQLANTQDIACRAWLKQAGLNVRLNGGDVFIVPTPNASMLGLFTTKGVDAAWTVEPWVSRLELEAGATLVYAEPEAESLTTVLVANDTLLREKPELAKKLVAAHKELNVWIKQHPEEARKRVAAELTRQMRREFPLSLVEHAWPRLSFNTDISRENFEFSLHGAREAGFIKEDYDLSGMVVAP